MIPLQTASGHPVSHILFSPDDSAVAVAQPHYGVTLLERATGRTLAVCAMPRRTSLTGLTFCGAGRFLAAAHAKGVEVFDATTGTSIAASFRWPRNEWHGKNRSCRCLTLAEREGDVIGASAGRVRVVWRPDVLHDNGFVFATTPAETSPGVRTVSANGRLALSARVPGEVLLDLESGRVVAAIEPSNSIRHPRGLVTRFCPLGRRFVFNDGIEVAVYDAGDLTDGDEPDQQPATPLVQRANGTIRATRATAVAPMPHALLSPTFTLKPDRYSGERGWYPPFALTADGRGLLVKRPRNRIQLWDAPTGTLLNEWSWQFEWVTCVTASTDGLTAVVGGRFGRVLIWDLE
jgi:WD40 repeat protein